MKPEMRIWRITKTGRTFFASASEGTPWTGLEEAVDVVPSSTVFDGMYVTPFNDAATLNTEPFDTS
jgi:hypothetical protein